MVRPSNPRTITANHWSNCLTLRFYCGTHTQTRKQKKTTQQRETSDVPDTKSLSQHEAFPPPQPSQLLGDFLKLYILQSRSFPFGWLHRADWGTVQSGRGGIIAWTAFHPDSMAQRKGWLVCPISERCHIFGNRDKRPASRRRGQPLSHEKQTPPPVTAVRDKHRAVQRKGMSL